MTNYVKGKENLKMKRYVKEFANDVMNRRYKPEIKNKINHYVKLYERGMITAHEAVKGICNYLDTLDGTIVTDD